MRWIFFICFCAFFTCADALESEPVSFDGMAFRLDVDESSLSLGRIVLVSELSNSSESVVNFTPFNTPLDDSLNGDFLDIVETGSKRRLHYMGRLVKKLPPLLSDFIRLKPTGVIRNKLDISESYKFCANMKYRLAFSGSLYDINGYEIAVDAHEIEFETGSMFESC